MNLSYNPTPSSIPSLVRSIPSHAPGSPYYNYGTAGFRDRWDKLLTVAPRIGLIATLRSLSLKNRPIGIMITASHNPVGDNGFKIIDADGGMLAMSWEGVATEITNAFVDDDDGNNDDKNDPYGKNNDDEKNDQNGKNDQNEKTEPNFSQNKPNITSLSSVLERVLSENGNTLPEATVSEKKETTVVINGTTEKPLMMSLFLKNSQNAEKNTQNHQNAEKNTQNHQNAEKNTPNDQNDPKSFQNCPQNGSNAPDLSNRPVILIGIDTRPSSERLASDIIAICHQMGAVVINYGLVTTPQLHWFVGKMNDDWTTLTSTLSRNSNDVVVTGPDQYCKTVGDSFMQLYDFFDAHSIVQSSKNQQNQQNQQNLQIIDKNEEKNEQESYQNQQNQPETVYIDVAHGVGYYAFEPVNQYIQFKANNNNNIDNNKTNNNNNINNSINTIPKNINTPSKTYPIFKSILIPSQTDPVNAGVGIDYALKNKGTKLHDDLKELLALTPPPTIFAVDGDCDRIGGIVPIGYGEEKRNNGNKNDGGKNQNDDNNNNNNNSQNNNNNSQNNTTTPPTPAPLASFIDGDRLIVLYTQFLSNLIQFYGLTSQIEINVVQTAYCNGASTIFLQDNYPSVGTLKACTGVKYLIEKTRIGDISVYFESNGHGSVHFNQNLFRKIDGLIEKYQKDEENVQNSEKSHENSQNSEKSHETSQNSEKISKITSQSLLQFKHLLILCRDLITPYIGDACGDALFAIIALKALKMNFNDLAHAYVDKFNIQRVVKVLNKSSIIPNRDLVEERLIAPIELQSEIDRIVAQFGTFKPRCFVRPSGTENVVRIFVESTSPQANEEIFAHLEGLVIKYGQ